MSLKDDILNSLRGAASESLQRMAPAVTGVYKAATALPRTIVGEQRFDRATGFKPYNSQSMPDKLGELTANVGTNMAMGNALASKRFVKPVVKTQIKGYNPDAISKLVRNSLLRTPELAKADRLSGKGYSLYEAATGIADNGKYLKGRISIVMAGDGKIVLDDGRHLLEAYRVLGKKIPLNKIQVSQAVLKMYPNLLKVLR